jgi:hypothetical protein
VSGIAIPAQSNGPSKRDTHTRSFQIGCIDAYFKVAKARAMPPMTSATRRTA